MPASNTPAERPTQPTKFDPVVAGRAIVEHIEAGDAAKATSNEHYRQAGLKLIEARKHVPVKSLPAFLKDHCGGLGLTKAKDCIAIAEGRTTVEEVRAKAAVRQQRHRDKVKATGRYVTADDSNIINLDDHRDPLADVPLDPIDDDLHRTMQAQANKTGRQCAITRQEGAVFKVVPEQPTRPVDSAYQKEAERWDAFEAAHFAGMQAGRDALRLLGNPTISSHNLQHFASRARQVADLWSSIADRCERRAAEEAAAEEEASGE